MADIADRKSQHIDLVTSGRGTQARMLTGFDDVRFEHVALPELDLDRIDTSATFLGRTTAAPLMVSAMTGGPAEATRINAHIAEACGALRLPFSVGSQRIAIERSGSGGLTRTLRDAAGDVPIIANLGAVQLNYGVGIDDARRAVDMIGADALVLHLNPLQEAIQTGGDRNFSELLPRIAELARAIEVPLGVKEVGSGISATVARRLADAGVALIDVAGVGGTSWARIEGERGGPRMQALAAPFLDWGIPTAAALSQVRAALGPGVTVIASGGIRHGLDVARAVRLGADTAGMAAGVLAAARLSTRDLVDYLSLMIDQLRLAMFCTGSADLAALRRARLVGGSFG